MYDNTELRILEQIYLKPGIHKRALSKQLGVGMPSIDYALKKVEGLVKKEKSGNQIRYFLDYSKVAIVPMLYAIEYSRFGRLHAKVKIAVNSFLEELKEKPVITAIFGSYARGDYTKDSDIDILLVFQNIQNEKQIEESAKKAGMRTNTTINPVYLDYKIFRDSFHNQTKTFFKNLKRDRIIINGIELWRQLENEEA